MTRQTPTSRMTFLVAAVLLGLVGAGRASQAQTGSAAIIKAGKDATAYVELTAGGSATAFCIDPAGYFVTNSHVSKSAGNGRIRLILNPSEPNQRITEAIVLREDADSDLALLRTTDKGSYPALALGDTSGLAETNSLTAFGYPFGKAISANQNDYPAASISVGRITSLRKSKGVLNDIQLDASLNPGNSGGPVLDDRGKVVGIVQGGVPGAALNFAIPVEKLKTLLAPPLVTLFPSSVPFERRNVPQEFVVEVATFNRNAITTYAVELTLGTRRIAMTVRDGKYSASAPLIESSPGGERLRVSINHVYGSVTGEISDQNVRIGNRTLKLSAIRRIERGETSRTTLESGEVITGAVAGFDSVVLDLGGARVETPAASARRIDITPPAPPQRDVPVLVTVRNVAAVVAEFRAVVTLTGGPPALAPARSTPSITRTDTPTPVAAPTTLDGEPASLKLPARIDNAIVAAAGRYLIFELRQVRQLAVFDIGTAKIAKYLPLSSDNVRIAASANKLVVLQPDNGIIQRWNLDTMEREVTVTVDHDIDSAAMGYASKGPLLVVTSKGPVFYDVDTLKRLELRFRNQSGSLSPGRSGSEARASADGTTFAVWSINGSPSGMRVITIEGVTATERSEHTSGGPLALSSDGSLLFTASQGIFSADLRSLSPDQFKGLSTFPSISPAFFLGLRLEETRGGFRGQSSAAPPALNIYSTGDRRLLVTLRNLEELTPVDTGRGFPQQNDQKRLNLDERVFYAPQQSLLVTVPPSLDALVLRRVNLLGEVNRSGADYLFVDSSPVRTARRQNSYQYQIDVRSRAGGAIFRLDSGPSGMRVSASGLLTWNVPSAAEAQTPVIVSIRDASGQELYHSFTINVR